MATLMQQAMGAGAIPLAQAEFLFWVIGLLATVFWIWMLIDCLTSRMSAGEKILWFLVIFFLPFLGSVIYFFFRKSSSGRRLTT